MIKGIIFDLDGTTINTLNELQSSLNEALRERGFPERTKDEVRMGVGRGFRKLIEVSVPAGSDDKTIDEVGERYREIYSEKHILSKPYEGIKELLEKLQEKNIKIAVNSNKSDKFTKNIILSNFPGINFTAIYGARENIPHKPDPSTAYEIIEEMKLNKNEVVYVGDSEVDMQTGNNAGLFVIGCLWGFRDEKTLKENKANLLVNKPEEIMEFIEKENG